MGGKGSGRKPIFSDAHHRLWRYEQLKYDKEIRALMKEHNCTMKKARQIRNKRRRAELRKQHQERLEVRLKEAEEFYKRKEKEKK